MLDRTLSTVWVLRGRDVPSLAGTSRDHVAVVEDVETLCASIVVAQSRSDAPYAPREMSDLYEALAFLLGRTFEVLPRYDHTRGRRIHDPWTGGFKAWLHDELTCDLIDQWRSWFGRHGQKRVSFIDQTGAENARPTARKGLGDEYDGRSTGERRSRGSLSEVESDRGDDGQDALGGLLESRDRQVLQQIEAMGLSTPRRAGAGVARPDSELEIDLMKAAA